MIKRPFQAKSWFQYTDISSQGRKSGQSSYIFNNISADSQTPTNSLESSFSDADLASEKFSPEKFFPTSWKAAELLPKTTRILTIILKHITQDIYSQFQSAESFNKSLRMAIFYEFLSYAEKKAINCSEIDGHHTLWRHLFDRHSPYRKTLNQFIDHYIDKVSSIYLLKVIFLLLVNANTQTKFRPNILLNLSAYITKNFPTISFAKLNFFSIGQNQYSWYRPTNNTVLQIFPLVKKLENIRPSEILFFIFNRKESKMTQTDFMSHDLSHENFGGFIKLLICSFPNWFKKQNKSKYFYDKLEQNTLPSLQSATFLGHELNSIYLSYIKNIEVLIEKKVKITKFIRPNFSFQDTHDHHIKHIFELNFLIFMAWSAKWYNKTPVTFIEKLLNNYAKGLPSDPQITIFDEYNENKEQTCEFLISNYSYLPKKNSHFYLIQNINTSLGSLKEDGQLIIFSNKKLFIPSQSDKIEQLLKKLTLKCSIDFEHLTGRGRIPAYCYIFVKKATPKQSYLKNSKIKKINCHSFRFSGELTSLDKFNIVNDGILSFIHHKRSDSTSLYQTELDSRIIFEFFQDAIVDGKLINSTSSDTSKITHPSFFKNIMKSCITFDQFFFIKQLNPHHEQIEKPSGTHLNEFLAIPYRNEDRYSHIMIIDQRDPNQVKIKIATPESFLGLVQEYGTTLASYFGLIPRNYDFNINLLREYIYSNIGLQISQITFSGKKNIKSVLNSLLIPLFFNQIIPLPENIYQELSFLILNKDELLTLHPNDLIKRFFAAEKVIKMLSNKYPYALLTMLTYFKQSLLIGIEETNFQEKLGIIDYSNPFILRPLLKLKTYPLLPENSDVFIEFCVHDPSLLNSPISNIVLSEEELPNNDFSQFLEIYSQNNVIIKLYSEKSLLNFIKYLLSNAGEIPISQALHSLKVPKLTELDSIIHDSKLMLNSLESISGNVKELIEYIFRVQISNS